MMLSISLFRIREKELGKTYGYSTLNEILNVKNDPQNGPVSGQILLK
jgi:hypothetical protein